VKSDRKTDRRKIQFAGVFDYLKDRERSHSITFMRFQVLIAALEYKPLREGLQELLRLRMSNPPPDVYRSALDGFARRYNLGVDKWCRRWLCETLRFSHLMADDEPASKPSIFVFYAFEGPPSVAQPPPPALNPYELPHEIIKRLGEQYLDEIYAAYQKEGYGLGPERRQPDHFRW
jgi:hypothetical protein